MCDWPELRSGEWFSIKTRQLAVGPCSVFWHGSLNHYNNIDENIKI